MFKAFIFVLMAVFVLYLPMGDPNDYCSSKGSSRNRKGTMCGLCDMYLMSIRLAGKIYEMTEVAACAVADILYEAKLKFYSVLEKIDKDDLCRSLCCSDTTTSIEIKKEHKYPPCKCKRMCSKKKPEKA